LRSLPRGDRTFERSPHRRATSASVRASRLNVRSSRGHLMTASADAWSSRAGRYRHSTARGNAPLSQLRAGIGAGLGIPPASRFQDIGVSRASGTHGTTDSATRSWRICPMPARRPHALPAQTAWRYLDRQLRALTLVRLRCSPTAGPLGQRPAPACSAALLDERGTSLGRATTRALESRLRARGNLRAGRARSRPARDVQAPRGMPGRPSSP